MHSYAASYDGKLIVTDEWQQAIAKSALKKIELSMAEAPDAETCRRYAAVLRQLQAKKIAETASLHLPFYPFELWQFASPDESARRKTVAETIKYMKYYEGLGIADITVHCGGEPNLPGERAAKMAQMRQTCLDLLPVLEAWDASLNLELLPRSCIGNVVEELLTVIDGLPQNRFGICLDVNHGMSRGAEVPAMIRKCAGNIRVLHISDYDNVDECHWHVGHGVLDWGKIITEVRNLRQEVLIIVETAAPVAPAWQNRQIDPACFVRSAEEDAVRMECAHEIDSLAQKISQKGFRNL